jgi:hypothetical protein
MLLLLLAAWAAGLWLQNAHCLAASILLHTETFRAVLLGLLDLATCHLGVAQGTWSTPAHTQVSPVPVQAQAVLNLQMWGITLC